MSKRMELASRLCLKASELRKWQQMNPEIGWCYRKDYLRDDVLKMGFTHYLPVPAPPEVAR